MQKPIGIAHQVNMFTIAADVYVGLKIIILNK